MRGGVAGDPRLYYKKFAVQWGWCLQERAVEELLAIVAITAATFVATSFDNLVLLIAFLGDAT